MVSRRAREKERGGGGGGGRSGTGGENGETAPVEDKRACWSTDKGKGDAVVLSLSFLRVWVVARSRGNVRKYPGFVLEASKARRGALHGVRGRYSSVLARSGHGQGRHALQYLACTP